MKVRRINIFGGPGSGKSTLAHYLMPELKGKGLNVEFVREYVKSYVFQKRKIHEFDQIKFLAKQLEPEYTFLDGGADLVVSECPALLSAAYCNNVALRRSIYTICEQFDRKYKPLNIFLIRDILPYNPEGRFQSSLEEAKEIDNEILFVLAETNSAYYSLCPLQDQQTITKLILSERTS